MKRPDVRSLARSRGARGSVLLVLVVCLLVLGTLGAGMVTLMTGSSLSGVQMQESAQARYLAESGLAVARSWLAVGTSSAEVLAQLDALHRRKTFSIPSVGDVDLAVYPHWFHTGKNPTAFPVHGGGFPGIGDETARAGNTAVRRARFLNRATFTAQCRDGSSQLLFPADPLPEDADIYLVGLLDRASSQLVRTGEGRWTLTVVPRSEETLVAFPTRDGLIGLVDDSGRIAPDKRFYYQRLYRTATGYTFEDVRPVGLRDGDPLPAARFLLHQTDLADKDLVLGQHVTVVSVARTLGRSKDSLTEGYNASDSFCLEQLAPPAAAKQRGL